MPRPHLRPAGAVHAYDNCLLVDRAAHGLDTALAWHAIDDAAVGLSPQTARALRRQGLLVQPGAYLPKVAIDTMPTLEAVEAAAAAAAGGEQAHD